MPIRCEIVSQDRMVFEGNADIVIAPGVNGEMGILPHHAPLLSTLNFGILKVRHDGEEEIFTIAGGVVAVQPNLITVLADAAENVAEIDVARAEAARRRAQEMLKTAPAEDHDVYEAIEKDLRKSNLRLQAARRYGRYDPRQSPGSGQPPGSQG
jgi:F-type H+-transporting ATPase subunit epsilon